MRIWHDTSYLTDRDKLMIDRGLARDGYHSLRFSFVYTPEEREQNRQMSMMSNSMHQERWHQLCVQDAVRRSDAMHQVMEEISKQFVCYQYDKGQSLRYDDLSWDLFFWCNDFSSTFRGSGLPDRDYSYFTLNFNRQHDLDKQDEIRCKVLELLKSKYADWPNLDVANQHRAFPDESKIQAAVKAALPIVLNYPSSMGTWSARWFRQPKATFSRRSMRGSMAIGSTTWICWRSTGICLRLSLFWRCAMRNGKPLEPRNWMMEKFIDHVGHEIVCVAYGDLNDPHDVCIECETCGCVLVSAEDFDETDGGDG